MLQVFPLEGKGVKKMLEYERFETAKGYFVTTNTLQAQAHD